MKMKLTILALTACTLAILPAQTAAPEKPATEEAPAQPKAETPLEKQAFKIFDIVGTLPDILGEIKDEASLVAAEAKLDKMYEQIKAEEIELLKLPAPDNDARKKLSAKMDIKEKAMNAKMQPVMMGLQTLAPEVGAKLGPLMQKFGTRMNEVEPTMNKYFQTDEEQAAKKGQ
jgi:hypothetical protein